MTTPPLSLSIRRLLAVSILLLLLFGGWSLLVWPLIEVASERQADVTALSDELEHLRSIMARRPVLEQTAQRLRARVAAQGSYWKGGSAAAIAANMQNLVRQTISVSGGQLKSTSEVAEAADAAPRRVSIRFQLEGSIETLQKTLEAIEMARPTLFVDSLTVNVPVWGANSDRPPALTVDMSITGLAELPPV